MNECYTPDEYRMAATKIANAGAFAISGQAEATKVVQMLTQAASVQDEVTVIGKAVGKLDLKGLEKLQITKNSVCHGQGDYTDEIVFRLGESPYDTLGEKDAQKIVRAVQFLIGLQHGRVLT